MKWPGILAEATNADDPSRFIWPVIGVLAGVIVLIGSIQFIRKRLKQTDEGSPVGFTLGDLRRLVKEGKMSPEEFERAKANILEANKRAIQIKPAQETTSPKQFPPRA
jgi:hypothetical protein